MWLYINQLILCCNSSFKVLCKLAIPFEGLQKQYSLSPYVWFNYGPADHMCPANRILKAREVFQTLIDVVCMLQYVISIRTSIMYFTKILQH